MPLRRLRSLLRQIHTAGGALLLVGLGLAALALWALAGLTEEVLAGETIRMDEAALRWFEQFVTPKRDVRALEITSLGSGVVVLTIAVICASLLAIFGRRYYALLLAVAVTGGWILSPLLKALFGRPRPQLVEWRTPYAGQASFPSGHAMMGMVLYVTLAYILHRLGARWWASTLAIAVAALLVILIGMTRVYLGVHYPSDVLAGYAVGFTWAMIAATAVEMMRGRS